MSSRSRSASCSRGASRGASRLAEATQRVGAGDLRSRCRRAASDEVGELTRAFNDMVRDLRESRERIDVPAAHRRVAGVRAPARARDQEPAHADPARGAGAAPQRTRATTRAYGSARSTTRSRSSRRRSRRCAGSSASSARSRSSRRRRSRRRTSATSCATRRARSRTSEWARRRIDGGDPRRGRVERIPVRIDTMMLKRCVDNLVQQRGAGGARARRGEGRVVASAPTRRRGARCSRCETTGPACRRARARASSTLTTRRRRGHRARARDREEGRARAPRRRRVRRGAGGRGAVFRIRLPRRDRPTRRKSSKSRSAIS